MLNALLVLDKPAGLTSHDVVNRVRRITGERSVGHLGTLDPMATGVLPLLLGRFTRLAQFFNDSRKVYEGEIRFGFATDTYDSQGEAVGPASSAQPSLAEIQRHLSALTGRIQQTPPIYSAKKIHGVPAYKLARHDKVVEMKPVAVEIHRFEVHGVLGDRARFVAEVSAGTYIRSLAHDLGQSLGCGAHLTELRRTQAGEFNIADAADLNSLAEFHSGSTAGAGPLPDAGAAVGSDGCVAPRPYLPGSAMSDNEYSDKSENGAASCTAADDSPLHSPYPHPRRILPGFPSVTAPAPVITAIRNGRSVNLPEFSDAPLIKVFAGQQMLVAIAQRVAGTLFQPRVVLFGSNEPLPEALALSRWQRF